LLQAVEVGGLDTFGRRVRGQVVEVGVRSRRPSGSGSGLDAFGRGQVRALAPCEARYFRASTPAKWEVESSDTAGVRRSWDVKLGDWARPRDRCEQPRPDPPMRTAET
jgi:hypothetical protein